MLCLPVVVGQQCPLHLQCWAEGSLTLILCLCKSLPAHGQVRGASRRRTEQKCVYVMVCGSALEPCWQPERWAVRAGQLWWLLLQHWSMGRGPGLIRNYVRGEKGKAAKNALSPPDWLSWPQADPCLCGWGQINWLINYPGKLDVALGCLGTPHISPAECHCALQLHWLRDWEGPSLPHGLFEQLSSVSQCSLQVARFTPSLLGNFFPLVPFSLSCFAQFQNCQSYSSEI